MRVSTAVVQCCAYNSIARLQIVDTVQQRASRQQGLKVVSQSVPTAWQLLGTGMCGQAVGALKLQLIKHHHVQHLLVGRILLLLNKCIMLFTLAAQFQPVQCTEAKAVKSPVLAGVLRRDDVQPGPVHAHIGNNLDCTRPNV